jgi:hypothetical protein
MKLFNDIHEEEYRYFSDPWSCRLRP